MAATSPRTPLFVRLPSEQAAALDDVARRFRLTKALIVSQAVSDYLANVDPPPAAETVSAAARFVSERAGEPFVPSTGSGIVGIDALRGAPVGAHSFTPARPLDVLSLEQLAALLDVDVAAARGLAEAGEIPGRRIGEEWRFSREAVMAWLAGK